MTTINLETLHTPVPVVGIGASAGGLKALEHLLHALPADSGKAFVVIQHLSPQRPTLLAELIGRHTTMPVLEARPSVMVRPNHVYVIPPGHDLVLEDGRLQYLPRRQNGEATAVDTFFCSLARERGADAVGIVLSGSGHDGLQGCHAILEAGGFTLAQAPDEAEYPSMPASVIAAGHASSISPVAEMPERLLRGPSQPNAVISALDSIIKTIRATTGHDFGHYKKSTIARRIERRMSVHRIGDQRAYATYLQANPGEVPLLFSEMLINVTQFFRDPEAFDALKQNILLPMLQNQPQGYVFRAWVAGCATGEEAYSLAIILQELRDELRGRFDIQVYATDLDGHAIQVARAGLYPAAMANQLTPARLTQWFTETEGGYQVRGALRKLIVFAEHNLVSHPPFTRLDLLCCRNLMIYLGAHLQRQLIPMFHYALKPHGVLMLSPSESIGHHAELFTAVDRRWKIYTVVKTLHTSVLKSETPSSRVPDQMKKGFDQTPRINRISSVENLTRRMLVNDYVPASVATDLRGNVVYVHGDTSDFLRPAPGRATLNVVDMARDGLRADLRAAVQAAAASTDGAPVRRQVRAPGNDVPGVALSVRLLPATLDDERLLLISFEPLPSEAVEVNTTPSALSDSEANQVILLEQALAHTREHLQATIDELQISNEEFCSTNEELQSANEELQSTNEELETSREELQSVNEELITVNAELQAKVEQLVDMQNDMKNLLDSIRVGTIFLDTQLRIRRFTRDAVTIYRLIAGDVGRPLGDITSQLLNTDLTGPARNVLETLIPFECEVNTRLGHWFLARIMPYRTLDNVIEGVVMTFHDITSRVTVERSVQAARAMAEAIIDTVKAPLLVLNDDLTVVSVSQSYLEAFGVRGDQTVNRALGELSDGVWQVDNLIDALRAISGNDSVLTDFCINVCLPATGRLEVRLDARRVPGDNTRPNLILVTMQISRPSLRGHHEEAAGDS
ncbi:chemotaxis protein CheB [Pseudomonas japonica]|uniref:chemotaxis protein CheB n=1 Tax=Pseudomonas japonica TaxID=256466 RepID=UPI002158FFF0|nr:chemotaxis protein CheB [Pseudomonas japonica]